MEGPPWQLILITGSAGVLGRICGCLWLSPVSVKWNRGKGSKMRLEGAWLLLGRLRWGKIRNRGAHIWEMSLFNIVCKWASLSYNRKGLSVCNNAFHIGHQAIFNSFDSFVIWVLNDIHVLKGDLNWCYYESLLVCSGFFSLSWSLRSCRPVPNWAPYNLLEPKAIYRKCLLSAKQIIETGKALCEVPVLL